MPPTWHVWRLARTSRRQMAGSHPSERRMTSVSWVARPRSPLRRSAHAPDEPAAAAAFPVDAKASMHFDRVARWDGRLEYSASLARTAAVSRDVSLAQPAANNDRAMMNGTRPLNGSAPLHSWSPLMSTAQGRSTNLASPTFNVIDTTARQPTTLSNAFTLFDVVERYTYRRRQISGQAEARHVSCSRSVPTPRHPGEYACGTGSDPSLHGFLTDVDRASPCG